MNTLRGHQGGKSFDSIFYLKMESKDLTPSVQHIVCLPTLPLTPNGKIDRQALSAPDTSRVAGQCVMPQEGLEQQLAQLWERVLDVRPVGAEDNFFDLGGHSLLMISLADELQREFGQHHSLSLLFHRPTVRQLAAALRVSENVT